MPKGIPRNQSIQQKILHRMKRARGHLDRVIHMMEEGDYCVNIINQSLAVQAALRSTDQEILRNHLSTCVADAIAKGKKDEVIEEVMRVMEKQ
jgi:DNA-binding FrmR family transcriptional regulator